MRIRNLFLVGLCIVAAPGIAMSVRIAFSTGSTWKKANEAIVAMRAVSDAQRAQTEIAAEVGKLGALLLIDRVDQASLAKDAAVTNKAVEAAARSVEAAGLNADAARSVLSLLVDLRSKLSTAFVQPPAARDPSLAKANAEVRTAAIAGVNEASATTGDAANHILSAAQELSVQAEDLNLEVGRFIASVQAA